MCGCGSTGPARGSTAAAAYAATTAASTTAALGGGAAYAPQKLVNPQYVPAQTGQLPTQTNVNDGSVRNAALAERTLDRLKYATQNLRTPAQAAAAGYHPNPSAPDHWINDDVFRVRNGYDLERPATLMFEGNQLVGVMLSHDPRKGAPPDLGAGSWHTHGGTEGEEYASHVWFNRPLQSAFGKEVGDV